MDHSEAVLWHRRLGHIGNTGWAQTIQNGQVEGVPVTTQSMSKLIKTPCESCVGLVFDLIVGPHSITKSGLSADSSSHQTDNLVLWNMSVCMLLTHTQSVQNTVTYYMMWTSYGPKRGGGMYKSLCTLLWRGDA
jgi:hypothetical protein